MKILQVNNVYGEKSTGKITEDLHNGIIGSGHESIVVFGRGNAKEKENVIRLCPEWYGKINALFSRITGIPYGGCFFSTLRLISIIKKEKPDIVHLQCINGNFVNIYKLIKWLKTSKIKTVCSLHAEFMYTGNCGYAFECDQWKRGCEKCPNRKKANKSWFFDRTGKSWKMMKDAFEGFDDAVIAPVSPWTEERAKESEIMKALAFQTVLNGIDTQKVFHFKNIEKQENTVLNVTSYFCSRKEHIKGGGYLVELAERLPEVSFIVAGKAEMLDGFPKNITFTGEIHDQEKLAELYSKAKVSVLLGKKETFSMPVAESLCCGTPVVGFKAGAPEQITIPEYSDFVEYGDLDALEEKLLEWLGKEYDGLKISEDAVKKYSSEVMIRDFLNLYGRILWN